MTTYDLSFGKVTLSPNIERQILLRLALTRQKPTQAIFDTFDRVIVEERAGHWFAKPSSRHFTTPGSARRDEVRDEYELCFLEELEIMGRYLRAESSAMMREVPRG